MPPSLNPTSCTERLARGRGPQCGKPTKPADGRNIAKCGRHRRCHTSLSAGKFCENYTRGGGDSCKDCEKAGEARALELERESEEVGRVLGGWDGFHQGQKQEGGIGGDEEDEEADSSGDGDEMPIPPTTSRQRALAKKTNDASTTIVKEKTAAATNIHRPQQHQPRVQAPPPPPLREIVKGATDRIRRFSGEKIAGLSSRFGHVRRGSRRDHHRSSSDSSDDDDDDDGINVPHPGIKKKIITPAVAKKKMHTPPPAPASRGNDKNTNKDFTIQHSLHLDLDARLRPLESRIDELLTRLPTATDIGTLLASVDTLTAVLWAMHHDREEEDDDGAPTAGGKGQGSGLSVGGRDGGGRVERKGEAVVNGLPESWEGEVQRAGWGKGKGKAAAVEEGVLLIE